MSSSKSCRTISPREEIIFLTALAEDYLSTSKSPKLFEPFGLLYSNYPATAAQGFYFDRLPIH